MSYYFPSNCDALPQHHYDACESREYGRIRSAGFIHLDFAFTDPTNPTEWINARNAGKIIMIYETNGESPKASPVFGPAYGKRPETLLGYNFTATYSDPNYLSNCDFYNHVVGNMNYKFFYRTSSHVFITDHAASITPNREIKNDLSSEIMWLVDIKWTDKQFPCPIVTPEGAFIPPRVYAPAYSNTQGTTHIPDHGGGPTG